MAIITISRGSYSKGKEIAEKVAQRLGYQCISRDVLLEASQHFHIPEIKLVRALHDSPSILERFTYGKERYIAFIEEAFLEQVQKDNVVYHGLAGHFFLKGVGHSIKVRIIADIEDRINAEMKREGISADEARHRLQKDDHERRKWSIALYGIDTWDPRLYDLVFHIHKISVDNAVDSICHAASLPVFQTTPESQRALDNLLLAAQVKAKVVEKWPNVQVTAKGGTVYVRTETPIEQETSIESKIASVAKTVPGVKEVKISAIPIVPGS